MPFTSVSGRAPRLQCHSNDRRSAPLYNRPVDTGENVYGSVLGISLKEPFFAQPLQPKSTEEQLHK
jgi:hypothetical protein